MYRSKFTEEELISFEKKQSEIPQKNLTLADEVKDENRIQLDSKGLKSMLQK